MTLPIMKTSAHIPYSWEVWDYLSKHNLKMSDITGKAISVSFRDGKRKRLKKIHIVDYWSYPCDCCGSHSGITVEIKGKQQIRDWN